MRLATPSAGQHGTGAGGLTKEPPNKPPKLRLPVPTDYSVGYAKPPEQTRFATGQSGNPRGRPRGSKNKQRPALNEERLKRIVMDEAYRSITVHDGARNVTIPMAQAVIRSMAVAAAKGHARAQTLFTKLLSTTEAADAALQQSAFGKALDYKIAWEREFARRDRLGIIAPPPLPHPDDIHINARNGTVEFRGPMTKQELLIFTEVHALKQAAQERLDVAQANRETETCPDALEAIDTEIAAEQNLIARMETALKGWQPRPSDAVILAKGSPMAITVDPSPGALPPMPAKTGRR